MDTRSKKEELLYKLLKIEATILGIIAVFIISFYFILPINNPLNKDTILYKWYWLIFGLSFLVVSLYFAFCYIMAKKDKKTIMYHFANNSLNYDFLLRQLISRDFKTKYKRSVLGVLWSFLNPLLMMAVQYLIFSTIFGNEGIPNYPVYLLIGVVMFQFFNETVAPGLTAITGNASLLNKVPIPKRLFPLSKVFSSSINFAFSLIPLFVVMLICGVRPSFANLLLILDYIFLFVFVYGLTLLLSAAMVYFRDVQFLWGVISMLWMYATPIFYDLDAIKIEWVRTAMKFNPMYHYITFARICLRDGACPDLMCFLYCIICSVAMFAIGMFVFKRKEKDFVLHL